jgi:hypothetical protein
LWPRAPFGPSSKIGLQEQFHSRLKAAVQSHLSFDHSIKDVINEMCMTSALDRQKYNHLVKKHCRELRTEAKRRCHTEEQFAVPNDATGPAFNRRVVGSKTFLVVIMFLIPFFRSRRPN